MEKTTEEEHARSGVRRTRPYRLKGRVYKRRPRCTTIQEWALRVLSVIGSDTYALVVIVSMCVLLVVQFSKMALIWSSWYTMKDETNGPIFPWQIWKTLLLSTVYVFTVMNVLGRVILRNRLFMMITFNHLLMKLQNVVGRMVRRYSSIGTTSPPSALQSTPITQGCAESHPSAGPSQSNDGCRSNALLRVTATYSANSAPCA